MGNGLIGLSSMGLMLGVGVGAGDPTISYTPLRVVKNYMLIVMKLYTHLRFLKKPDNLPACLAADEGSGFAGKGDILQNIFHRANLGFSSLAHFCLEYIFKKYKAKFI